MDERTSQMRNSDGSWPTWRDKLHYRLGYLQATVDMQTAPKSGGWIRKALSGGKDLFEGFEMGSKLWRMQQRIALPVLIVSWWDYVVWFVRLLVDLAKLAAG
jgi:hypothetical protein